MSTQRLANIVEKLQVWAMSGMLMIIIYFGKDVYTNVKESHDLVIMMKQRQEDQQKQIDRHESELTELLKSKK